jgi:hypothetical protein
LDPINGGSIWDLRYAGGGGNVAKIDTRGAGVLEIDHITILSGGTDDYQIMQTTNTTVFIHHCGIVGNQANSGSACVQDFIKLGGTTTTMGDGSEDAFQGYGTKLYSNMYNNIQRGVIFQVYANAVIVEDETYSATCGSALAEGAPYYFDAPSPGYCASNTIRGSCIELSHYVYGVSLIQNAVTNYFDGIGVYDGGTAGYYSSGTNTDGNLIVLGNLDTIPPQAGSGAGGQTLIDPRSG